MARTQNRLSARAAATIAKPGRHADGNGLYLVVDRSGARRWIFMFRLGGKLKELGLGGLSTVSLAKARDAAADARRLVRAGTNPIDARRAAKAAESSAKTFGDVADLLLASLAPGFRNKKHVAQWKTTLQTYASSLRKKPVATIGTDDILDVLQPIWLSKPETAARLRGRIERVLDAARAKELRQGENPARWRGHLDQLLPRRLKIEQRHHAAMPFAAVPAFVARLRESESVAALALEFAIVTACRTTEVAEAQWGEIDKAATVWTIPAERMKAGHEHRVPLSARALAILEAAGEARVGDYVFPGQLRGKPLSNMAMAMLMRRLGTEAFTVHGFRSPFRDWAGEATAFPREVAEAALAHVVGDKSEQAYRRADALTKRRKLMDAWAGYLGAPNAGSKVLPMSGRRHSPN